ncbi:MAG: hypothetical protein ACYDGN_17795 [Acidimicrobiales bacterium]
MPYGCLVQWHALYDPRLASAGAGRPLTTDPSDLIVMEAAIEAQQEGLAPITPKSGHPYHLKAASGTVGQFWIAERSGH